MAVALGVLFLTGFCYFVLRLYLQTKQPEEMGLLRDLYVESCKGLIGYQEGIAEHHLALAGAVCKLASGLSDAEYTYHRPPRFLEGLGPSLAKLSCLLHWRSVLAMRELLLFYAIEEYVRLVRCAPTTLEIHAALANAYVCLSCLYIDPRKIESEEPLWLPPGRHCEVMWERFRSTAKRAVEELHILKAYAPNDPWVHAQLAYSYHDLQMPQEEISEYEALLRLQPDDLDTMFKLGIRYFQQAMSAKGLQVYERLKRRRYHKADELMRFYDSALPTPLMN